MTLTLLLDLDDTLLCNPLDKFFPAYIAALSAYLSPYVDPKNMVPQLLHATDQMIAKDTPCSTLEETFSDDFYSPLGLDREQLRKPLHDFYASEYDNLRHLTTPLSAAVALMEHAKREGWRIVIATNPLFPRIAVQKRLEWAGLPAEIYPFRLLTSYEGMHFSKPNAAFYAEVLGSLGWPEGPVCMVGNSISDDLVPAAKLGIPCYWVTAEKEMPLVPLSAGSSFGTLDDIVPWLDRIAGQPALPEVTDLEGIFAVLKSTPASLESLTKRICRQEWRLHPIPGEWSLLEIICHLRDVEREVNLPRFEVLSTTPNPFIPGVDSDRWAIERKYNEQDDTLVYTEFCSSRSRLLEIMGQFNQSDWQKSARHSFFGKTTRLELAKFIAAHDRTHLQQIAQTIQALK